MRGSQDSEVSAITSMAHLADSLDRLRRRAAVGTRKARVSIDDIARRTGIPRSTVHVYVSGRSLPPPDVLDQLVASLGATTSERRAWVAAADRLTDMRSPTTAPVPALPIPRQTPPTTRRFVGRESDLATLSELLLRPVPSPAGTPGTGSPVTGATGATIVVTGAGGIGKTTLVAEWSSRHGDQYPDGILYADLRGFASREPLPPSRVLTRFLIALGHRAGELSDDVEVLMDQFRSATADRRMLIVLDNARDLAQIESLLPGASRADVIVTSRDELRPLLVRSGGERITLAGLTDAEAAILLDDHVDAESKRLILQRCAGHPLALQVVRERIEHDQSAGPVIAELTRDADVLDALDTDAETGVRAVMRWSYDGLSEPVRRAFRLLAVVPTARWSLEMATDVLAISPRRARAQLDDLTQRHLLSRIDSRQWSRHDLITAFAAERLAEEEPAECRAKLRERATKHLYELARAAVLDTSVLLLSPATPTPPADLQPGALAEARARLSDAEDVIITVLDEIATEPPTTTTWALAECALWAAREQHHSVPLAVYERLLKRADELGAEREAGVLRLRLGQHHWAWGEYDATDTMQRAAAEAGRRASMPELVAAALSNAGGAAADRGRIEDGERLLAEAIDVVPDSAITTRAGILLNLGVLHSRAGRIAEMIECYERAAELGPDGRPTVPGIIAAINLIGHDLDTGADLAVADQRMAAVLSAPELYTQTQALGPVVMTRAALAVAHGDLRAARTHLEEGMRIALAANDAFMQFKGVEAAAQLAIAEGNPPRKLFEEAIDVTTTHHMPLLEIRARLDYGDYLLEQGEADDARSQYTAALRLADAASVEGSTRTRAEEALRRASG